MSSVTSDMTARPPRVRLTGALGRVTASAVRGRPVLRAELAASAGGITLIWLGRDRIAGIEPGRKLAVEGTLTRHRGRTIMYNPRYELAAEPPCAPGA